MSLLAVATTLAAVLSVSQPAQARDARPAADDLPLQVTITGLNPSVVPREGPLQVSGTVSNTGDQTYDAIRLYGLTSTVPITSRFELATAAASDPAVEVGNRILDAFDSIDSLAPGESAPYSIRIPRRLLPIDAETSAPGVYWLGVHALGETSDGRDLVADGKARTFLPLVHAGSGRLDTALVVSLRHAVRYRPDGSVGRLTQWRNDLGSAGRLSALVGFARAAGPRRLTWLVDPAVTDAVSRLAAGNPPRWLGRSKEGEQPPTLTGAEPVPKLRVESKQSTTTSVADEARGWLSGAASALAGDQLLALPYGDMDVSAAATWSHELYQTARREARGGNAALDLPSAPVVSPPDGYLDPAALGLISSTTTTIVSDAMLSDRPRRQSPVLGLADGKRLVFADAQAASGGPLPGPQLTPLQERQRILSDAALRLLGGEGPLVVALPTDWEPGSPVAAEEFFAGLDVPWLRLAPLRQVVSTPPATIDVEQLRYPTARAEEELPSTNFEAAGDLLAAGEVTQSMLPTNHTLAIETTHQALTATSYGARARPMVQSGLAMRSRERLERLTAQVTVEAPRSVTLSSESGQFSAIVTNSLEQRVAVRVVARTDGQLRIKDSPVVELAPGEVRSIELTARSSKLGLHDVRLAVADVDGVPLGASDDFQLRAAQVSNVIWVVFAVGGALLFGAIAVRLYRRIRDALGRRRSAA